jgi:glyceraldehyde 3-phosphate dehydrogenase
MAIRVAINGFGRIGRNILRAIIESGRTDIQVVAVNDLGPVETNAHLLRYDSVHGRFPHDVIVDGDLIKTAGQTIKVTAVRNPAELPHAEMGVDIVLECTGIFTSKDKTIVYGINHAALGKDDIVISNGSCTTNCLAPMALIMNELVGIEKGMMTTIHSYTGDQPTLDTMHKDLYRGRAAALSQIPTSTGAAKAIGLVLPELKGKLDGVSIRVPTPNVSLVDLKFLAGRATTAQEVNDALIAASRGKLKGVMTFTSEPLVSSDLNHDPHSCTILLDQTKVIDGNFVNIMGWYDNEWGFSNRMADTTAALAKTL